MSWDPLGPDLASSFAKATLVREGKVSEDNHFLHLSETVHSYPHPHVLFDRSAHQAGMQEKMGL